MATGPYRAVAAAVRKRAGLSLLIPVLIFLVVFFFFPLLGVFLRSLNPQGELSYTNPTLSLENYRRLVADEAFRLVLRNTFEIALFTSIICLVLGYPVAYLLSTFRGRLANRLLILTLLPFWVSILVRLYAWTQILGRFGLTNTILTDTGLISQPLDLLYTRKATILGMVHYLLPYMILVLYATMKGIDRQLLVAARSLGATRWQSFYRIFWRLSLPGVYAGLVLVFVLALGFFLTPAVLGGPRDTTIAVYIQQRIDILDWGVASAMGMVLLGASAILFLLFDRLFGFHKLLTGVLSSGRGVWSDTEPTRLTVGRVAQWIYFCAVLAFLLLPLVVVVPASVSPGRFLAFPPEGISFRWYEDFVDDERWFESIALSLQVALLTVVTATPLGLITAIGLTRFVNFGRTFLRLVFLSPLIIPLILTAIATFDTYSRFHLVGSIWGLALAHTALALPFAVIVIENGLRGVDPSLEKAGMSLGASPIRAFISITIPIIVPSIVAAAFLAFLTSWEEVVVALFLTGLQKTLPVRMFIGLTADITPTIAAISTILVCLVILALLAWELSGVWRSIRLRRGRGLPGRPGPQLPTSG